MYIIPGLALLAALFADTQVPATKTAYGACPGCKSPSCPPRCTGCTSFGGVTSADVGTGGDSPEGSFGALTRAEMAQYGQLSRGEMAAGYGATGYGAVPGSWDAAWYGVFYGGAVDAITQRIEQINSSVMKIIKKVLGWGVATKGPKLIGLNNKRDKLIMSGVPLSDPRIAAIEQEGLGILTKAGLKSGSSDHVAINALGDERDVLLLKKAGLA